MPRNAIKNLEAALGSAYSEINILREQNERLAGQLRHLKDDRKILECDDLGCETACCYGCKCCEQKSKIMRQQETKIKDLQKQLLETLARDTTNLGSVTFNSSQDEINKLKGDNNRLREERSQWRSRSQVLVNENNDLKTRIKKLEEEKENIENLLDELDGAVEELRQQVRYSQEINVKQKQVEKKVKQLEVKASVIKSKI